MNSDDDAPRPADGGERDDLLRGGRTGALSEAGDPPPADGGSAEGADEPGEPRKRHRLRTTLISVGVVIVLLVAGAAALVVNREHHYNANIHRIPNAFPTDGRRPAPSGKKVQNWLLVGSDTRAPHGTTGKRATLPKWSYGAQRTDTIMLVHVPADRRHAYVVSFPRDSWVPIPGHGTAKINAAYSWGGPPLLISTFERLTGVRVDHFGIVDFRGFQTMTDALGGVDVDIAKTVHDPRNHVTWTAGRHHLDGRRALLFVRQRYNLPGGDFDRIKRQQSVVRALASKAISKGTLSNPLKLNSFFNALTQSVSVDSSATLGTLRSLALSLRKVRTSDLHFMTAPVAGTGMEGGQSVVHLATARSHTLFAALRGDRMTGYVARYGGGNHLSVVR